MGLYKDRNNFSKPSKHNNNKRNKQHNNTNQNNHSNNVNNDDDNNNTTKSNNGGYKLPTYYDIKIGEKNFFLSSESLNNDSPNFFTAAFFGYFQESNTSKIFIERDPVYFDMFVRYLRGYEVDWPFHNKTEMINLLADAKFYGFENLRTTLEEAFNQHFPKVVIPWKILTYAPENEPILAINIKDVELVRWDGSRLLYNANSLLKRENNISEDTLTMNSEGENDNDDDIDNNIVTDVNNNINNDNNNNNNNNNNNGNGSSITQIRSDPEKKLYKLEIHGRDAFATVTSSLSNGVKFENFTFKNSEEEQVFKVLSDSFRINNNNNNANANANGNANANTNNNNNNNNNNSNAVGVDNPLTLSPSLKLPFLKDTCIEIDNHKYHSYNDLSTYFSVTSIRKPGKPLYFEELVIRIDGGVHLLRAKAWTIPSYYASQPFIKPVNQHLSR